ncbi:MAG: nucleotidyltransferase family protein [Bacteroidales bacterium]|nr:nucleotidyltransferase family protein [Bacteroidales bacterium]MBR4376027.1 nucleotidyltransferase family protein [Spirochaetia bacterium]
MGLFFELLQVALGTREKLSLVPDVREWKLLYEEAGRQTIVGVLFGGLEQLPEEQLPPVQLKLQWIGMVKKIEVGYRLHVKRSGELAVEVKDAGFESSVLKGVAMARYYPKPERRQCGDIDLWISGCRKDVMKWLRSRYETGHCVWHNVGVEFFKDVPVEVHFHPGWLYQPWHNRRLQRWFDGYASSITSAATCDGQLEYNVMPVEFDVVYSLVHSYRHLIAGGIGLRHVVDYFYVLKTARLKGLQIDTINNDFKRFGLLKFASAMMWVQQKVCGMPREELLCEPDEKEGRFLLNEIRRGGNFGHYSQERSERGKMAQLIAMLPHYPGEVLWVLPWKCWHLGWRVLNR